VGKVVHPLTSGKQSCLWQGKMRAEHGGKGVRGRRRPTGKRIFVIGTEGGPQRRKRTESIKKEKKIERIKPSLTVSL